MADPAILDHTAAEFTRLLAYLMIDEHLNRDSVEKAITRATQRVRLAEGACPMKPLELVAMEMVMLKYPPGGESTGAFEINVPQYGVFTIVPGPMSHRKATQQASLSDWVRMMGSSVDMSSSMKPDCVRQDMSAKVYATSAKNPNELCTPNDVVALWNSVWNNNTRISPHDKAWFDTNIFNNVLLKTVLFGAKSSLTLGKAIDKTVDATVSCIGYFGKYLGKAMGTVAGVVDNPVFRQGIDSTIEGAVSYAKTSAKMGLYAPKMPKHFEEGSQQAAIWRAIFEFGKSPLGGGTKTKAAKKNCKNPPA